MNLDIEKPNRNSIAVESKAFNALLKKHIVKNEQKKTENASENNQHCEIKIPSPLTAIINPLEILSSENSPTQINLRNEMFKKIKETTSNNENLVNKNNNNLCDSDSIKNTIHSYQYPHTNCNPDDYRINPFEKTINIDIDSFNPENTRKQNRSLKRDTRTNPDHISIPEKEEKTEDSIYSKEPVENNQEPPFDNNWDDNIRKVLRAWKNITKTYAYIHDRSALYYYCIHVFIQLPVIIFSTLTGASGVVTFAFGSEVGTFHWINIITTGLSFIVALLSACYTFFNPQKTREKHIRSCNDLQSYSKSITIELLKKKNKREDAYIYLQNKSEQYDNLIESMPPFPLIPSILYRSKLQRINNVSKYSNSHKSNQNICSLFFKHTFCCLKGRSTTTSIDSKAISDSVTNSKNGKVDNQVSPATKANNRKSISMHISKCKPNKKPDSNDILNILYENMHQNNSTR